MNTNPHKVSPITVKVQPAAEKRTLCICKTLAPSLSLCRLMGLFPVTWEHQQGKCVYKKSLFWLFYTAVWSCYCIFMAVSSVDYLNMTKNKSLIVLLDDITSAIYNHYIPILMWIGLKKYPTWIRALNNLNSAFREGIPCQTSKKVAKLVSYFYMLMFTIIVVIESAILGSLIMSERYETHFGMTMIILRTGQNMPFLFYLILFSILSLMVGVLDCFEKLTINALHYVPVHPMKDIDQTSNTNSLLKLYRYNFCKDVHQSSQKLSSLPSAERLEELRILHEDICLRIYDFNDCFNPHLLLFTVVELSMLIIQWYAVIAYMAYTFNSPRARTIHVLNCRFVVIHTLGLYLFLKNAQNIKNSVQSLMNFLLEYSLRVTTEEEHRQIRIFIEKLKQHRPFTASGVFTIDLGIAAPIAANILTYVLVALQFEIPEE